MDISKYDVLLVRKNGEYLVAVPYTDTLIMRWSTSPYDGARLRRRSTAKKIADRVGGIVAMFNPITGNVKL